jgi:hypothetical protein
VKFRKSPYELAVERIEQETPEKVIEFVCSVARDALAGPRGDFLLTGIRNMEVSIYEKLPQLKDQREVDRALGAMAALSDLRTHLISLLPEDEARVEDEAEEDFVEYDSPFQIESGA